MKPAFFNRSVVEVARDLIGCVARHDGCARVIVECEAYRSYGVHALLNAVCEPEGLGAGVLIRALQPIAGFELMRKRRGLVPDRKLCSGPGKLTQALGIGLSDNGVDLDRGSIVIRPRPAAWSDVQISVDRRIGITKAVELPWRFCATGSRFLSRPAGRAAFTVTALEPPDEPAMATATPTASPPGGS